MVAITKRNQDASAILNTISNESLQAFFDAKEQFFSYRQFNNSARRRDFASSFTASINHFLLVSTDSLEAIYEHYVRSRAKSSRVPSPLTTVQSEWDRFSEFFDAAALVDIVTVKRAYRKAARTLHPDVGGNAGDMVALNAVFAELLDMLMLSEAEAALQPGANIERSRQDGTRSNSSFACGIGPGFWPGSVLQYPRSVREFEILLRTEALLAAIDVFDEDRYAQLAQGLGFNSAWACHDNFDEEAFEKADACEKVATIIRKAMEASAKPGLPYGLPGLRDLGRVWIESAIGGWITHGRVEARETLSAKKFLELENRAITGDRFTFIDEWRADELRLLLKRIEHPKSRGGDRFQLNHMLQAENAFRRGLVTPARYKKTVERLKGKRDALAVAAQPIIDLASTSGFMTLEHDPYEAGQKVPARSVPERVSDSFLGNWKLDSPDACRAYNIAYYQSKKVEGKLIFVRQRLWILLSSLIANPERWGADRILSAAHEVALLEKAARVGREGLAGDHAADLRAFLSALAAEDEPQREERLRLLGQLAREDFRDQLPEGVEPTFKSARSLGPQNYGSPLMVIVPSPDYYRAALRSLEEFRAFDAGASWFDPEHDAEQDGLRYYHEHMQKLANRMFNAVDVEPAKKKVAKLGPLIRQAVDQNVPLNAAAEWQLGYYMDRLTGAMVRARQFVEAAAVLEEYFALPDAYRRRSTPSEDKRLRARLIRFRRDADLD